MITHKIRRINLLIYSLASLYIFLAHSSLNTAYAGNFAPMLFKDRTAWIKTSGGDSSDRGKNMAMDDSGNIYIAGWFTNTNTNTNAVIDFNGTTLNGKTSTSSLDVYVAKFNQFGTQQWIRTLGGTGTDLALGIAVEGISGNVYVTGQFVNTSSNSNSVTDFSGAVLNGKTSTASTDAFVAKLDTSGTQEWIKTLGGTMEDAGNDLSVDSNGNAYVIGYYTNSNTDSHTVADFAGATLNGKSGSSTYDAYVVKINSVGNQQWIRTLGGSDNDWGYGISLDSSSNVYVSGFYLNSSSDATSNKDFAGSTLNGVTSTSSRDIFVAKLNTSGTQQWIRTAGGTGDFEYSYALVVDSSANVYAVGRYFNNSSNSNSVVDFAGATLNGKTTTADFDILVAKLNSSGTQQWIRTLGGIASEEPLSINVDGSNNVYVTGYYLNSSANSNSVTDFSGAVLNGKTSTTSADAFITQLNSSGTQQWIKTLGGTGSDLVYDLVIDSAGVVCATGKYVNNNSNASTVTDFAGNILNGKTTTVGNDSFIQRFK
jgi:hypothetical protein